MTAAQKTAKANFKKAIEYRKKTGVSLKEAFAHVYGKKVGAVKKKAAPKKKAAVKKKAAPKKVAKKKVAVKKQTGTSVKYFDKLHQAKPVGKRTTKNPHKYHGKTIRKSTTYTESKANRSDKGVLLGITSPRLSIISSKNDIVTKIDGLIKYNADIERYLIEWKQRLKTDKSSAFILHQKKNVQQNIKKYTALLKSNKQYLTQLKKAL